MEKKYFEIKSEGERKITLVASSENTDRDGDRIFASGWKTDNFLKNGALLYGHNPTILPLAKPVSASIIDKKLVLSFEYAKEGTSAFHDSAYSLIAQGILKGVSVGYIALEYKPNEFGGRDFTSQELVETSLTPIPSNVDGKVAEVIKSFSPEVQKTFFATQDNKESGREAGETSTPEPKPDEFINALKEVKKLFSGE